MSGSCLALWGTPEDAEVLLPREEPGCFLAASFSQPHLRLPRARDEKERGRKWRTRRTCFPEARRTRRGAQGGTSAAGLPVHLCSSDSSGRTLMVQGRDPLERVPHTHHKEHQCSPVSTRIPSERQCFLMHATGQHQPDAGCQSQGGTKKPLETQMSNPDDREPSTKGRGAAPAQQDRTGATGQTKRDLLLKARPTQPLNAGQCNKSHQQNKGEV